MARDHGAATFTISDALVCSSPLPVANQTKTHQPTKKLTSSRGAFWSMGPIFCGTFPIVFQMSMLAMVPFLAAIASTHTHMKGEDISSQRSIVHLLQIMKCLNDTVAPNPRKKRSCFSCCYSCDIFRNVYTKGYGGYSWIIYFKRSLSILSRFTAAILISKNPPTIDPPELF